MALALKSCKDVTAFGLGGVNRTYFAKDRPSPRNIHNLQGEAEWLAFLDAYRQARVQCI